jgi:hypothetical protein
VLIIAGFIGALGASDLRADGKKEKIDCKDTDLGLSAPGYEVTCTDLSNSTMSVDEYMGGRRTEKLEANSDADQTFLIAVDNRPLGQFYLRRRSLENDIENYFNGGEFKEWASGAKTAQFEVEEFTGESDDGTVMECIGFRHSGARRYDGIARLVVGIACSAKDRSRAYEALKHLDAPSG